MMAHMMTDLITKIPAEKMMQYKAAAAKRQAVAEAARRTRIARAWEVANQAAQLLKTEFGATQVALFGSLVQPSLFQPRSDVDLAAWGINETLYYRAVAQLLALDAQIAVDLVRIEDASPSLHATVLRDGVPL